MEANRSLVVFGTGAVGGYLGGKLAQIGDPPDISLTLVGRPAVVDAVHDHGLIVRELDSEQVSRPQAVSSTDGMNSCDLVILTVRGYDVERSLPDVKSLMGPNGLLLSMQNGVGTEELLAQALGRERVLVGTLTVSTRMEEPAVITRSSRNGGVALSTMNGSPVPSWVSALFSASSLPTIVVSDYRSLRWSKLLLNMLGAASTAILNVDMGSVVSHHGLFRLEQLALREAGRVIDAQQIRTIDLPGYPVTQARLVMRLPRALAQRLLAPRIGAARGGRAPSMREDMMRGRSEIGYLNGAVAEAARRLSLPAPVNEAFTTLTEELRTHPNRRAEFQEKPDTLIAYMRARGVSI